MKKILVFALGLLFMLCCAPVQASNVNTVKAAIVKHSIEMGVDPAIALSIAKSESGFRQESRSPRGAVGVFQLMPSTARRMGYNPYTLDGNIKCGIAYYKSMYKMFGSMELALAAYNAGPGNVKKYKAVPPFRETKRYVAHIMGEYRKLKANPDPAMIAAKKNANCPKSVNGSTVKVLAKTPENTPLPTVKIEQSRNLKMNVLKEIPIEVQVKSQTVAI